MNVNEINHRRVMLIHKDVQEGLTPEEEAELEKLEAFMESLAPKPDFSKLDEIAEKAAEMGIHIERPWHTSDP